MASISRHVLTLVTLTCLAGSVACDRGSEPASAKQEAPAKQEADSSGAAAAAKPKVALKSPDPARLGTLPEGLGVAIGEAAPDAEVETYEGKPIRLSEVFAGRKTLLVFYRGGWCPFCNVQIHQLTEANPEFAKRGISLAAVSVDRPDRSAETKASYEIPFPVLSDSDLAAHRAFRVMHEAPDEEAERLASFGMDLEAASGRTHHTIAVPSVFLIDEAGVVRWAHADPDYKTRPSTEQLLAALDELGS